MTNEIKVSKGPLGEYIHLNIPNSMDAEKSDTNYEKLDWII